MSSPHFILFYGDKPVTKRPPQPGQVYLWTDSEGVRRVLLQGEWVELTEEVEQQLRNG